MPDTRDENSSGRPERNAVTASLPGIQGGVPARAARGRRRRSLGSLFGSLRVAVAGSPGAPDQGGAHRDRDLADVTLLGHPTQSSVGPESKCADPRVDASGALCRHLVAEASFQTSFEDHPWWEIAFDAPHDVAAVCVYDRSDHVGLAGRCLPLEILVRDPSGRYLILHVQTEAFGGLSGPPSLRLELDPPVRTAAVRLRLAGRGQLALAKVDILSAGTHNIPAKKRPVSNATGSV